MTVDLTAGATRTPARDDWLTAQREEHITFVSWPMAPDSIAAMLPPGITIDTFAGDAWVTVAPHHISELHLRDMPPLPFASSFAEVELRTYVTYDGEPGVWYFSVDAPHVFECWLLRHALHIPYYTAEVEFTTDVTDGAAIQYRAERHGTNITFASMTRPIGAPSRAAPETIESFLHERYALFAQEPHGTFVRGDVAHAPWPLQVAECEIDASMLFAAARVPPPSSAPLVWYSRGVDCHTWPPVRLL